MKMKRISSLFLVLVMSLGLLTGCGEKKSGVEELPEGTVTLTVGIPQNANTTSYDDNAFTNWLEEQANVEIEFEYYSSTESEFQQQLALQASANEPLPDMLLNINMNAHSIQAYGEDGYFIDLKDYVDEYGVNYKKGFEALDETTKNYINGTIDVLYEGAYYAMPGVASVQMDDLQSIMYINKNWLDKLNLPIPTTVEELRSTLQAFKNNDPNGNGATDEIPMLGDEKIIHYLTNAFVLYDHSDFNITDGKVWDPVMTDEFRQAMIYANQLVKDNLYDKMSFSIQNDSEYKTLISPTDGPSKVGIFVGHHELMTNSATDALTEFVALPSLAAATDKGGYTVVKPQTVYWSAVVTKDCEYPAAAMKLIDTLYTDEAVSRMRHGEMGVDWEYEEGTNSYGSKSYVNVLNTEAYFSGNSTWCRRAVMGFMNPWNYIAVAEEGEGRLAEASRLQTEQWTIRQSGKQPDEYTSRLVHTVEEFELREAKLTDVNSFLKNWTIYFVSGEKDPSSDSAWEEFVTTLKSLGREEIMETVQSAYDRQ